MLLVPFLTELDSRAAVRGSRDPLGVQPIWAQLGRQVIGNLTTVTTSLPDFIVTLLGYHFVEQVERHGGDQADVATFLKWEQLAGYARSHVNGETAFRGTDRVRRALSAGSRVRLAADPAAQILGDQKTYGLWGLYTGASKTSGLLAGLPARLTAKARAFVETEYLPELERAAGRNAKGIVERLRGAEHRLDCDGRDRTLMEGVATILKARPTARARRFFREHLVLGGRGESTKGVQGVFAEVLAATFDDKQWTLSPESIRALAIGARTHGPLGQKLAWRLERIRTCEQLIAPGAALFEFVLNCHDQDLNAAAERVRENWGARPPLDLAGTDELGPKLAGPSGDDASAQWPRLARALEAGNYVDAIEALLAQNAAVMRARGGAAAWVEVRRGKLDVRYRDERLPPLPKASALPFYWRHAYFIHALRGIAFAVREPS